jgi:hypothetical protein
MNSSRQADVICLLLAAHAVLDFVLLGSAWELHGSGDLFFLAWPFSQGSLIALWAGLSRISSFLRLPAALLGIVWTWFLTVRLLDFPLRGEESAGWAAMFATQALSILVLVTAGRLIWYLVRRGRPGATEETTRPVQFSLRFLLLWMTLLAVILGLGSTAFQRLGWTPQVVRWQYFYFGPVLGAGNALFALIVLLSLAGRTWLLVRMLLASTVVSVLGYAHWYVLMLLFGNTGGVMATDLVLLAVYQVLYLYATLLPLHWAGCLAGERRDRNSSLP